MTMLPKIVDNGRKQLGDTLNQIAASHKHLSIATGYWDLPGLLKIFDNIENYESIRLIIGQEPLAPRFANKLNLHEPEKTFPEVDFKAGLVNLEQREEFRELVFRTKKLIDDGRLNVKVYRRSFLHAKAYVFGNYESESAVGVIGSSNFTGAGLTTNTELNAVESDHRIVKFQPHNDTDEYGHLSWFDSIWNDELNEDWNGTFTELLQDSPVGDLTFGAYDVYIKTLMEVFPDELIPKPELGKETQNILYSFQNRNAGILINKLEKMGTAILSDSVGLGKTITAGAVVRHYIDGGAKRIVVIVPASLKQQWKDDLANVFGLLEGSDFVVVSQQDLGAMENISELDKFKQVDLFIVDEAHNLRNTSSTRYEHILGWFQNNPDSKVLLLTATPINNSLNDLVNQIQLGLKGELDSVLVPYHNPSNKRLETIDFFDALNRIQKRSNVDPDFDWNSVKPTLVSGISHYLVRSTRQGVEEEGGIITGDGTKKAFPESIVSQIEYKYSDEIARTVSSIIEQNIELLEGIDARKVDLDRITDETQRSSHPFDFADSIMGGDSVDGVIPNIFQLVTLFGFTPYKPETYQHKIYQKTPVEIRSLGIKGRESQSINLQLAIHNMLLVTWLKRLESSAAALLRSMQTYERRLESFNKWLEKGYILSFKDIEVVEQEYGEDIDRAFDDYDQDIPGEDESVENLERRGVERKLADDTKYNVNAMIKDIARDRLIARVLIDILTELAKVENDSKIRQFAKYLEGVINNGQHGKKVLVFSFFADTINYLRDNLNSLISISAFNDKTEYISGQSGSVESIVRRFSPESKKYTLQSDETELDFLFATDILSEGQNLQDAGVLINYDLHWNPVRMIQRNGRVNRLGSRHSQVLISNLKPEDNIELYLNLIARLQRKINTIKHTVGLDQGVLSGDDVNPLEFVEDINKLYNKDATVASNALKELEDDSDILSWTNTHIYRLREFLSSSDEQEIARVQNISVGKWNYLPAATQLETGKVLSLQHVEGKTSITNQPIVQSFFIETETSGEYASVVIDDLTALHHIQTEPEDNERLPDHIKVDRETVNRRSTRTARRRAEASDTIYEIKPRQLDALTSIQPMFPDIALRPYFEKGIKDSRHKRQFENIVRTVNNDLKTSGAILVTTVSKFEKLVQELSKIEHEETRVSEVTPVLHYARRLS